MDFVGFGYFFGKFIFQTQFGSGRIIWRTNWLVCSRKFASDWTRCMLGFWERFVALAVDALFWGSVLLHQLSFYLPDRQFTAIWAAIYKRRQYIRHRM